MTMIQRLHLALAILLGRTSYAVIYDSAEGIDTNEEDRREEFYECFSTPQEAVTIFRTAFPKGRLANDGDEVAFNPRLVAIMGPVDAYGGEA